MYHDPEKLAKTLGIPKLPDFLTQEAFSYPALDDVLRPEDDDNRRYQKTLLEKVNVFLETPATTEELVSALELFKIGMHYVQHKTGQNIERDLGIYEGIHDAETGHIITDACCFDPDEDSYVITIECIANWISQIRNTGSTQICSTPHKPSMGISPACDIVVSGAEESHHAVTFKEHPDFCGQDNDEHSPIAYFKNKLERAFGDFLPALVSDFGFEVKQFSILESLDDLRGALSREEYLQLQRERIEEKYGFNLPTDDEIENRER